MTVVLMLSSIARQECMCAKTNMAEINTNESPGDLSCENMMFSHVKISPLLWLHRNLRLSYQKTIKVKWLGISLVFI